MEQILPPLIILPLIIQLPINNNQQYDQYEGE